MFETVPGFSDKRVGELRHCAVRAGSKMCPSAEAAKHMLDCLCGLVNKSAEAHTESPDEADNVLNKFALAAFAQYHFVEIHPFHDGNGRMCRYICKHILESCLPVPIPMYDDKPSYIQALQEGDAAWKNGDALAAHVPLLVLTIDSAIAFYESLNSLEPYPVVAPSSTEPIEAILRKKCLPCTPEHVDAAQRTYEDLPCGGSATIELGGHRVRVLKAMDLAMFMATAEKEAEALKCVIDTSCDGAIPSQDTIGISF
jgi:hypothetical protein